MEENFVDICDMLLKFSNLPAKFSYNFTGVQKMFEYVNEVRKEILINNLKIKKVKRNENFCLLGEIFISK